MWPDFAGIGYETKSSGTGDSRRWKRERPRAQAYFDDDGPIHGQDLVGKENAGDDSACGLGNDLAALTASIFLCVHLLSLQGDPIFFRAGVNHVDTRDARKDLDRFVDIADRWMSLPTGFHTSVAAMSRTPDVIYHDFPNPGSCCQSREEESGDDDDVRVVCRSRQTRDFSHSASNQESQCDDQATTVGAKVENDRFLPNISTVAGMTQLRSSRNIAFARGVGNAGPIYAP